MKHLIILAALFTTACGPSFAAQPPAGAVEIKNDYDDYDYRATTADGLVFAVREIDNDAEGDNAFWLTAIKNRMRERNGYALLEEVKVQSADGVGGTQLRFGHDESSGSPHLYYLTLFVTPKTIYLVEAGGTKELMTKQAGDLDAAIKAFRTQ
jgi:hypothetical protein